MKGGSVSSFSARRGSPRLLVLGPALAAGLALVLLCAVATAAEGDPGVRTAGLSDGTDVHLKSGEVIQDAVYDVDYRFKVLRLTLDDGGTRSVSFTEIAAILSGGVDITESILGPGYGGAPLDEGEPTPTAAGEPERTGTTGPPGGSEEEAGSEAGGESAPTLPSTEPVAPEAWLSEQEEAYREARARSWTVAFRGGGSYDIPFGDYYEGIISGVGFEADLLIAFTHGVGVRLSVSKVGMQWDEDVMRRMMREMLGPDATILDEAYELSALRFTLSGVTFRHLDPLRKDRSMVYGYGGIGFVKHDSTTDLTVRDEFTGETIDVSSDYEETKFVTTLGGGFIKSIGTTAGVDLSINLDQLWLESNTYSWIVDIRAGLVVFF
jgi:hypothetical protein